VRHRRSVNKEGRAGPAGGGSSAARHLLLLVDLDPGAGFAGRVDVVGRQAGGSFAGWIDFMAVLDAACAGYGAEARPAGGSRPGSTSQGARISSRREAMRSFS
jgi:hypothetical protein